MDSLISKFNEVYEALNDDWMNKQVHDNIIELSNSFNSSKNQFEYYYYSKWLNQHSACIKPR